VDAAEMFAAELPVVIALALPQALSKNTQPTRTETIQRTARLCGNIEILRQINKKTGIYTSFMHRFNDTLYQ
jgi:hypothetical protein